MAKRKILSLLVLYPISKIYGMVIALRNAMFNKGILKQHSFDVPVVVVGNISMGGAGKTPHTEYLVNNLKDRYRIAVLSRGYKRKTKGFVMASPQSHVDDIGDEPYQIYHKFKDYGVAVAVCESRVKGINMIKDALPDIDLLVLDDAFQHRYVKPTVSVVLMDYHRPAFNDHLLPFGRLREPVSALNRADVVVVTKCPENMKPMETRIFKTHLNLFPYQKLLFSSYHYLELRPLFPDVVPPHRRLTLSSLTKADAILAVTGVAYPVPFVKHLRRFNAKVRIKRYADHHKFTHSDIDSIAEKFNTMSGAQKIIVTTEKDGMRLLSNPYIPHKLKPYIYYMPIEVTFPSVYNEVELDEVTAQLLRTNKRLKGV